MSTTQLRARSFSEAAIRPATLGDTLLEKHITSPLSEPTTTGSGQNWDFSSLTFVGFDTLIIKDTSDYPSISVDFPNAEFVLENKYDQKEMYSYQGGLRYWGYTYFSNTRNGTFYSIPRIYTRFPINNSIISDSSEYTGIRENTFMGTVHVVNIEGDVASSYMASGSLTLPNGITYNTAILIQSTLIETEYNNTGGASDYIMIYDWYVPGCPLPIMTISADHTSSNVSIGGFYISNISNTFVATNKIESKNVSASIFPNPTSGIFNIEIETKLEDRTQVTIYNAIGIKEETIDLDNQIERQEIDLSNYATGIYYLEISIGKEKTIKQVIIE